MASLADRFAEDISLEYSLVDRIRVRGHLMHLQSVGMLSVFFKRWRNVSWIEPRDLQKITDEFVQHVESLAEKNDIPLLSAKPGDSHVDQAAAFLPRVADQEQAIYCIIKVQEETSSFVSYRPKNDPGGGDGGHTVVQSAVRRGQLHPHQQLCPLPGHGLLEWP